MDSRFDALSAVGQELSDDQLQLAAGGRVYIFVFVDGELVEIWVID
jgi:hypothetical protein